jgi:hypothetical protein
MLPALIGERLQRVALRVCFKLCGAVPPPLVAKWPWSQATASSISPSFSEEHVKNPAIPHMVKLSDLFARRLA